MARTAWLVCLTSTVSGHSKKRKKTKLKIGASSGHVTNLKQSIFSIDIYVSKQVVFSVKEAFTQTKCFVITPITAGNPY